MLNLSIFEIERACGGRLTLRGAEGSQNVEGVVLDSRKVAAGSVFVATVGERVDGHRFIPEVFAKGASLVITEKTPEQVEEETGVLADTWGSYVQVKDSFQALKDIAEYYRSKLTIPIVGITGSVGKTSTKEFIAGVLEEKFHVLKTEGNYNNEIGVPLTLLRISSVHQAAVVEMGISDFGEMHRLSKMVKPDICVITNIVQCHLENLKSRDGILKAKTEIFDFMSETGEVCLNGEDDKLSSIQEVHGKKPHFFGMGGNPFEEVYAADVVSRGLWGSEAFLHMKKAVGEDKTIETETVIQVKVPLPGVHMVINSAAAACVARLLGLTDEQIAEGISKVRAIGGRNNLIRLSDYTLIDDCYNANPISMRAALDLLAMADTEKVAILGDMFELGEESDSMHARIGAYAAELGIEHIICVGESSLHMSEAAKKAAAPMQQITYFATREQLLQALSENRDKLLPKGCTILLKASHGMQFTEVLELLKNIPSCS